MRVVRWSAVLLSLLASNSNADPLAGTREPIVLMWQVHPTSTDDELAYLASHGVTLTQSFAAPRASDSQIADHLEKLQRHGLQAALYLGKHEISSEGCAFPPEALERVRRFQRHEALAIWHILDEPAMHDINKRCQIELYDLIKSIDSETPIMISANNNRIEDYELYFEENAFDILEMHYYVNPHPAQGQANLLKYFHVFRARDYQVIITLRAFNSPHKPRRLPLLPEFLSEQYEFFIENAGLTKNFALYGWDLSPNRGIKQVDWLRNEFELFMDERQSESQAASHR